jgi:preprotein translocase subunit YajC
MLATAAKGGFSPTFLIIIVLYAAVYFGYLRPKQKKARAARAQSQTYNVGDQVTTIGGLIGTVVNIDTNLDQVTLRVNSGQELTFVKRAIQGVYTPPSFEPVVDEGGEQDAQ